MSEPYLLLALIPLAILYKYLQTYYRQTARELRRLNSIARSATLAGMQMLSFLTNRMPLLHCIGLHGSRPRNCWDGSLIGKCQRRHPLHALQAKQASCQCNAMDEICFACAMKSAVSSKARELSRHAKGFVSGISNDTAIPAIPSSGGHIGHLCMHLVQAKPDVKHGQSHGMMSCITLNGTWSSPAVGLPCIMQFCHTGQSCHTGQFCHTGQSCHTAQSCYTGQLQNL